MSKFLIAYATAAGSTGEVAEAIGKALRQQGATVDVRRAKEVDDASGYDAVVLGTGVRAGRTYAEAGQFLAAHRPALSRVPVAGFVWDHWLLFNIPADVRNLPEGVPGDGEFPDGSRHGKNSFNRLGYGGPCPPSGQTHQYKFTLYAIDTVLDLEPGATKDQLLFAIEGHILEEAQLVGVYTSP